MKPTQPFEFCGLTFKNRVMTASGTYDPKTSVVDPNIFGAVVLKSATRTPRSGNNQPRIVEAPCGMINRIGLENPGVDALLDKNEAFYATLETNVIGSAAGESVDDYEYIIGKYDKGEAIKAIEVNVSCPNVEKGLVFGTNPDLICELFVALRRITRKPLIAKMTPNVTNITVLVKAALNAGVNAVCIANTLRGCWKNRKGDWVEGGYSGPGITPIILQMIRDVRKDLGNGPAIIGCGGINSLRTAELFFECGASAIQIGSCGFGNPLLAEEIVQSLQTA